MNNLFDNLQERIDACHAAGGGEIVIPPGRHITPALILRSNVHLRFLPGAVLCGSTSIDDYERGAPLFVDAVGVKRGYALIYAGDAHNIGISGPGVIDGNGAAFEGLPMRPMILRFVHCSRICIRDVMLRDSGAWVQHFLDCEDITIDGIEVQSTGMSNNDGINLDGCRRVTLSNSRFNSGDDGITLKTTTDAACRDVAITNCHITSECNGIKLGTESRGDFRNITVTNCTLHHVRLCGIEILSVDGANIDTVNISNITMDNVGGAVFLRLGRRSSKDRPVETGSMKNISITNVLARIYDDLPDTVDLRWCIPHGARSPSSIMGLPGHSIENIYLGNIDILHIGTGTMEDFERPVEEKPGEYPQWERFGPLPAWGFYFRHARNVTCRDLRFRLQSEDVRPCLYSDDVEKLSLSGIETPPSAHPLLVTRRAGQGL